MAGDPGAHRTPWDATVPPALPALDRDVEADVCVIGAGISGLSIAYSLLREGRTVAVLEDGAIGSGQTGRTSAHLSDAVDDRYAEIERLLGSEAAMLVADSHSAAIQRIEKIVTEHQIDCDFTRLDGYLFFPPGASEERLEAELAAATRAGLNVTRETRAPISSFDTGPCLRFPNQAQFHPLHYLVGLARAIRELGGQIFCSTRASEVCAGRRAQVVTVRGPVVSAGAVVVATNVPFVDRVAIHTKQAAYLSYVIAAHAPEGALARALFWDDADPYHYVRFQRAPGVPSGELLLVGGEDHRSGQVHDQEERFGRLEAWARERFPLGAVAFRWSGQVMEPIDGVAFIGRNPGDENVFIATGDSGMGMTHGTIAGMLISDLIVGRENPWAGLYDPSRKTLRAARRYAQENVKTVSQYADWFKPGDLEDARDLASGEGAVLRRGLRKIAVYRDEKGELCAHSAVCPHLGCIVQWNSSEKTWDCPCHGSRFDRWGTVIVGPARRDLTRLPTTADASRRS
jgi:glycine/D-amino acid oxidase-like deaminating enzyme/nitrite reductase/ring-hydroxylating ferredoxin subunit